MRKQNQFSIFIYRRETRNENKAIVSFHQVLCLTYHCVYFRHKIHVKKGHKANSIFLSKSNRCFLFFLKFSSKFLSFYFLSVYDLSSIPSSLFKFSYITKRNYIEKKRTREQTKVWRGQEREEKTRNTGRR